MTRSNGQSHNGRGSSVLDAEPIAPIQNAEELKVLAPAEAGSSARASVVDAPPDTAPPDTTPDAPPAAPAARKRPIKLILAAAGVGAIAAGAFGFHWWQYASSHEETDNATVAGHIHQISARIPGTVKQILVDDNQQVKAGQTLVKLDPRDYQIKLQQAQAELASAQQKANSAQI